MIRTALIEWREKLPNDINYKTYCSSVSEQLQPADQSAAIALFSATNRQAMLTILVAMSNLERYLADKDDT